MEDKLKIVDLFSGSGAFSYVFKLTNKCNCIFSNDIEKTSDIIHKLNFTDTNFILDDIHNINVVNIPFNNILCAGFPCQPFSIAGNKKGFDDIRSNVFWKIIEILKYHNTEIVILENVKNLISHDKGNTFKIIIDELKKLDYYIKYSILDTCKITDIPQHRERIYIICFKNKNKYDKFEFNFEEKTNKKISDFLEDDIDDKYYYTNKYKVYDIINNNITKNIYDDNVIYQYRRFYLRENKNNCCPTLTANMGTGGHNVPLLKDKKGIRKLTPRECFNLQGFPKNYILPKITDNALYKIAGNAVSIPVIELIINNIINLYYS